MRILIFGKTRNVYRWPEDVTADLRLAGHQVLLFPYNNNALKKRAEPWLLSPSLGVPLAAWVARAVRRFEPDLVLAIGPFHWLPPAIFTRLAAIPGRPPLIAWVGDMFDTGARAAAEAFDIVAYTDSGMVAHHEVLGFRSRAAFVPLAASRAAAGSGPAMEARNPNPAFVGSATDYRRDLLARLTQPVSLFGPDWRDDPALARHVMVPRRIGGAELMRIYRSHASVLNMRNERNVINGLNQRHFAPYIEAAPVVTDDQADIAACFEPGREIVVYRDADDLNEQLTALRADPARAQAIGLAGQRAVLSRHTYTHRVETMAGLAGVRSRGAAAADRG